MAGKQSAATERAIARVAAGEQPSAAARAEGIALSTIYRAQGKTNYAYDMGAVFASICEKFCASGFGPCKKITPGAMGNVSRRPDLIVTHLRHLDLSGFDIPLPPDGWKPSNEQEGKFWIGYYHGRTPKPEAPLPD